MVRLSKEKILRNSYCFQISFSSESNQFMSNLKRLLGWMKEIMIRDGNKPMVDTAPDEKEI